MSGKKSNKTKYPLNNQRATNEEILSYIDLIPNPRIFVLLSGGQDGRRSRVCSRLLPKLQLGTDLRLGGGVSSAVAFWAVS